jgi:hypothetical protein
MTARDAALAYGARAAGPCSPATGKVSAASPLVEGGFHAATTGETLILEWWHRWPQALIGMLTRRAARAFSDVIRRHRSERRAA